MLVGGASVRAAHWAKDVEAVPATWWAEAHVGELVAVRTAVRSAVLLVAMQPHMRHTPDTRTVGSCAHSVSVDTKIGTPRSCRDGCPGRADTADVAVTVTAPMATAMLVGI